MIDIVYFRDDYTIGAISIDAVTEETHHLGAEISDHPLEEGLPASDSVRPAPRTVELRGVITNTPISLPTSHTDGAQAVAKPVDATGTLFGVRLGPFPLNVPLPMSGSVRTFVPEFDRVQSTWEEFRAIFAERRLVDIVTTLDEYQNMQLSNLVVNKLYNSYDFTCVAREVRTVKSETVDAAIPAIPRAARRVSRGTTSPPQEPSPPEPLKSTAVKALGL